MNLIQGLSDWSTKTSPTAHLQEPWPHLRPGASVVQFGSMVALNLNSRHALGENLGEKDDGTNCCNCCPDVKSLSNRKSKPKSSKQPDGWAGRGTRFTRSTGLRRLYGLGSWRSTFKVRILSNYYKTATPDCLSVCSLLLAVRTQIFQGFRICLARLAISMSDLLQCENQIQQTGAADCTSHVLFATQNASANHLLCDSHATRTQPAVMSMAKELGQRAAHAMGGLTCLNTMIINQNRNVVWCSDSLRYIDWKWKPLAPMKARKSRS